MSPVDRAGPVSETAGTKRRSQGTGHRSQVIILPIQKVT